ncbi:MAG: hypothetical protein IT326_03845, partial [Anaerolineae bacterium]|nr:hypothetical protein [Anaerolineae bacterium]
MSEFNPTPHEQVVIGGVQYAVMPHPAVPNFAFGQEGRKAFVYQLRRPADDGVFALKKFKQAYRLPELVDVCAELARFSRWPGLEAGARTCLVTAQHPDILGQYPDLEYAVLMPWIHGSTWYDMVVTMTPLTRRESVAFANGIARVLDGIEEA